MEALMDNPNIVLLVLIAALVVFLLFLGIPFFVNLYGLIVSAQNSLKRILFEDEIMYSVFIVLLGGVLFSIFFHISIPQHEANVTQMIGNLAQEIASQNPTKYASASRLFVDGSLNTLWEIVKNNVLAFPLIYLLFWLLSSFGIWILGKLFATASPPVSVFKGTAYLYFMRGLFSFFFINRDAGLYYNYAGQGQANVLFIGIGVVLGLVLLWYYYQVVTESLEIGNVQSIVIILILYAIYGGLIYAGIKYLWDPYLAQITSEAASFQP